MYLVKFSTNSNQEFINQPFDERNNKMLQKAVITQSYFIEELTEKVLKKFEINDLEEAIKSLQLLEYTSGKATFVTSKGEVDIINAFEEIFKSMMQEYNEIGIDNLLSFNYKYYEVAEDYKDKKASDIISDSKFLNQGLNVLENHFETLKNRNEEKEFITKKIENIKEFSIDLEQVLKVNNEIYNHNKSRNLNSYNQISKNPEEYIFNKMLLFKLDLNNLGLKFNELKDKDIKEYAETSYNFYKIVNRKSIDARFKKLQSKTMFAAGDDIFLVVNFNEIEKVISIIEDVLEDINQLFESSTDKITCAGGLIVANHTVPIRMYYEDVEEKLSNAKLEKDDNYINFADVNYSFNDFKKLIIMIDKIIGYEKNFRNSSTAYYTILNQLQNNNVLDPFIVVSNSFVNETIKISKSAKHELIAYIDSLDEQNSQEQRKLIINIIEMSLLRSYTNKNDIKEKKYAKYENIIEKKLKEKYIDNINTKDYLSWLYKDKEQVIGTGFLIELLNIMKSNEEEGKKNLILELLFRKYNAKYLKLVQADINEIDNFVKYYSENTNAAENLIYANIVNMKIKNTLIGE